MLVAGCLCGSGTPYAGCCGRLHLGTVEAQTAEQLMRARFAAYAIADLDFVFRTWHPRTRPGELTSDPALTWTGLTVLDAGEDEVAFVATHSRAGVAGELRERSRFERRRGRWVYLGAVDVGEDVGGDVGEAGDGATSTPSRSSTRS